MTTVLLLGGRSFLGGHICRALLTRGYHVLLQSRGGEFQNLDDLLPHDLIERVVCDLGDRDRVRELLARSHAVIYAAAPYHRQSLGGRGIARQDLRALSATMELIAASGIDRTVYVSVAGTCVPGAATVKRWGHLKAKIAAEEIALRMLSRVIVVNPTMCVGEYDTKPSTGVFFRLAARFPFLLMPEREINFVDVEFAALGVVLALERGRFGQRYVLSGTRTTMGAFTRHVRRLAGHPAPLWTVPEWLVVVMAYGSELANLLTRRDAPAIPLLGIELIRHGSRGVNCDKAVRELRFIQGDAWGAVDRAWNWYVTRGKIWR